ncbi:DNA-directed RNA polymerase III subunit RPC7 isoform X2 [Cajanus cajan]|uniref:DNA-directed RNA polymerase III subunit RPC7 isoform X2 n=1 Tax=Cajanus cajan TaxID=3821 RepID=UPI00098D90BB|nr:DNA-directed RNA polymerase III subunit RPC7 isoform X2 [Cajanus cajan]
MAGRGRGRGGWGRGRGGGGGFTFAAQVPFDPFPEDVTLPEVKIGDIDASTKKLLIWSYKLQNYWKASPYHLEERTSKSASKQTSRRKKFRWNPESGNNKLDFLEQQEEKNKGKEDVDENEKKDGEDEEDENAEEEDDDDISEDDYHQNEYFDDDEDDYNDVEDGNDEPIY